MLSRVINYVSLISFLLIFSTQLNAQKSITGVVTEEIITKDGKFLLHRTTHLPKGKTISGTVMVEPKSDKTKKREKQIENLAKYILKIGDQIIGNDGIFTINLPYVENIPLQVFTSEGKLVQEIPFELSEPIIPENLKMPKTIRKDIAEKITGDFSGDITNANILLNENPVDILAGNDTELFFKVEDIEPGKQDLSLEYDDIKVTESINVVDYTLQAGRLNLNRGESTYLDVKVVGLQDLQEPLELKVQNQSVGTIRLEGGDIQIIQITPSEVAETGTWEKRFDVQSLTRGKFSVQTNIDILESEKDLDIKQKKIVDCEIDGVPMLVSFEICEQLKKKLQSKINELPEVYNEYYYDNTNINIDEILVVQNEEQIGTQILCHNNKAIKGLRVNLTDMESSEMVDSFIIETIEKSNIIIFDIPIKNTIYEIQTLAVSIDGAVTATSRYVGTTVPINPNGEFSNFGYDYEYTRNRTENTINRENQQMADNEEERDGIEQEIVRVNRDAWDNEDLNQQLIRIDAILDEVESIYSDSLRNLLDSVLFYNNNFPEPNFDALQEQIDALQDAKNTCYDQLKRLEDLLEQLNDELVLVQEEYYTAGQELVKIVYQVVVTFGYDNSRNRPHFYQSMIDHQREVRHEKRNNLREVEARLAALPEQIIEAAAHCDEIASSLEEAEQAMEDARRDVNTHNYMLGLFQRYSNQLCGQIEDMLEQLEQWCNDNPEHCSNIQQLINDFKEQCPENPNELNRYWRQWQHILNAKRQREEQFADDAESHRENVRDLRDEIRQLDDEDNESRARIQAAINESNQAYRDLIDQRERARLEEARKERERCRICEDIMDIFEVPADQISYLSQLWELKNELGQITELVQDATNALDELTSNDGIEEFCDAMGGKLEQIQDIISDLDDLEGMDNMADEIGEVLNMLQNPGDNPEDRAENFLKWLDKTGDLLEHFENVPILGFVISYFTDFIIPAANAIVNGAQEIIDERAKGILGNIRETNCASILSDYERTGSVEGVCDAIKERGANVFQYDNTNESINELIDDYVRKKLMDCCLEQLASPPCRN